MNFNYFKSRQIRKFVYCLVGIFTLVLIFESGYVFGLKKSLPRTFAPLNNIDLSTTTLKTVNYIHNDDKDQWLDTQIRFPSRYYVTNDNMITDYHSQGGMAPAILSFTTKDQFLGQPFSNDIDCINVWATKGFTSFQDWEQNFGEKNIQILSENKETLNHHQFIKRVIKDKETREEFQEVLLQLPKNTSYFFSTCNMNSVNDLEVMLENFHLFTDDPQKG